MTPLSSKLPWFLASATVALVLGALVTSPSAPAQDAGRGFVVDASPGKNNFPLALPRPVLEGVSPGTAAQIHEVIQHDLELTGYFKLLDPAAFIESRGGVEPGEFDFGDWQKIRAGALAKTRVRADGDQIAADIYIYDVPASEKIVAKRFKGGLTDARYLGHRIADEILLALTGQPGFFGTRIAAVGERTGNKEIYVLDVDGAGLSGVTRNGSINLSPAWSPSGDHIAWTSYKRGNPDLYQKDLTTGRTRVLSSREGINSGAAYSPDGTKVALARSNRGDSDIYILDAKTGAELVRVTSGGGIDVAPNFSPDGRLLAFSSERSGGSQIFVYDLETEQTRRVTFTGSFNTDPVFSPDGRYIAFVGRTPRFNVFVVGVDGQGMTPITQDQGDNEDPSWSPDGRYVVFSSTRTGKSQLFLGTPSGVHQVALTKDGGGWTQPAWSPSF